MVSYAEFEIRRVLPAIPTHGYSQPAMPFAPPSSIGDIIAIVTLAVQIGEALNDSRGASNDYRELIDELDAFRHALSFVDEDLGTLDTTSLPENLLRFTKTEIDKCRKMMEKFLNSIEGYKVLREKGRSSIWRKIIWSLFKSKEVAAFRGKISRHQHHLWLLIQMATR
jgi:hypothetical protein